MDVWDAAVVEEVRVWGCGDEDGGEVGELAFISRGKVMVLGFGVGVAIPFPRAVQWLGARSALPRAGGRCRQRRG